ncbi:MAG: TauD/TfdA family dioxygenase [Flavobacteriales bacterium]|nr:TauD/TfdA family dioxygenase [Flavobacteriales bacterium]
MKQQLTFYKELEYFPGILDVIKAEAEQTIALYIKNVPEQVNLEEFYAELSKRIGYFPYLDEDPVTAEISADTWTEIKYVEEKRFLAYKYSDLIHPLHTDYCYVPRNYIDLEWSCLFCKKPADIGGATVAVDPSLLLEILQTREPELYNELITVPVVFERAGATYGANTSKIIDFDEVGPLFCWSPNRVSKTNTPEALDLCKRFHQFLDTKIVGGGLTVPINLKPGDALIFQDKRYLHGRNSFYGNRFLKKTAIVKYNVEGAKKLVAELAV